MFSRYWSSLAKLMSYLQDELYPLVSVHMTCIRCSNRLESAWVELIKHPASDRKEVPPSFLNNVLWPAPQSLCTRCQENPPSAYQREFKKGEQGWAIQLCIHNFCTFLMAATNLKLRLGGQVQIFIWWLSLHWSAHLKIAKDSLNTMFCRVQSWPTPPKFGPVCTIPLHLNDTMSANWGSANSQALASSLWEATCCFDTAKEECGVIGSQVILSLPFLGETSLPICCMRS